MIVRIQTLQVFADSQYLLVPDAAKPNVVLHPDASDLDILEALLARSLASQFGYEDNALLALEKAHAAAGVKIKPLRESMIAAGWSDDSFMFPDVSTRAKWPSRLVD